MSNVENVSVGKPKIGGAIFRAPLGTKLPTDATTALDAAFSPIGYISDDGAKNANAPNTDSITAWGGLVVMVVKKGKEDTFKFKMIESLNTEVLKSVYGDDNVTGELTTGIAISANNNQNNGSCWVIDMILTGDVLKRLVIPNGMLSDLDDIVYKDDEPIGYDATISALPDTAGNTHYDYMKGAAV